jgi:hypothetical protein
VKRLVPDWQPRIPFSRGAEEIMSYYDADPFRQTVDPALQATMDRLVELAKLLERG